MLSTRLGSRAPRARPCVEEFEPRCLLSGSLPSAVEQLFLEELNDARANPAAYGASIGVSLPNVAPSPPLAFNQELIQAAQLHSQDMNTQAYFDHNTPEGVDPGTRITQAGFVWTGWGESIAGGTAFPGPATALAGLITDAGVPDLGHRMQLLDMSAVYQNQGQVGIGIVQAGSGPLADYYTIDTASSAADNGPFLTGVVFNDMNGTGKYAIGEGLGGVTITVAGVGSTTTWDSGGYSFEVPAGTYTVTASGGGLAQPISQEVSVGLSNVRVNFSPSAGNYINKLYLDILGRKASAAEIPLWLPVLQSQGASAVAASIEHSGEARTRLVDSWYVAYLGRKPAHGEEQAWVNLLLSGATEETVTADILASGEFYARAAKLFPSAAPDQSYVEELYSLLLKRNPSAAELKAWSPEVAGAGRAAVAAGFLDSGEFRALVVQTYYTTLLHRTSPASAAEVGFWVSTELDLTAIRIDFEQSPEFFMDG